MHQRVLGQLEEVCTQFVSWKGKPFQAPIQAEMHCYGNALD